MKPKKQISEEMKEALKAVKKEAKEKAKARAKFFKEQAEYGNTKKPKLAKCPFCGGKAEASWIDHKWLCGCKCIDERVDVYSNTEFSPEEWNTRPIEIAFLRKIQELEEQVSDLREALVEINK